MCSSVSLSLRAKRGIEEKSVNQKEKEISVLVFIQIDLIQIEYPAHAKCGQVPPAHAKRVYW